MNTILKRDMVNTYVYQHLLGKELIAITSQQYVCGWEGVVHHDFSVYGYENNRFKNLIK